MKRLLLTTIVLATFLGGCCNKTVALNDTILTRDASAGPLQPSGGFVYTDNDEAFRNKIRMIQGARKSIDLSYYIFSDDESSSLLTRELIKAAQGGVKVRLLVDYETNYYNLDLFSMIAHEGKGKIQVRLYNRPTANIVKDAVFLTMGCSKEQAAAKPTACSDQKYDEIDKKFDDEKVKVVTTADDGTEKVETVPAADLNVSNLNIGNSGLFLSGLYAKQADALTLAVESGGSVDLEKLKTDAGGPMTPEKKEQLKKLGRIFWQAKTGNIFQKLQADVELYFIFGQYGQQLNPIKQTVTSILPVDRPMGPNELRDWDHYTDYTHHKFLLVDGTEVQIGGRNVENFYHMNPNPLLPEKKRFVFMDTDLYASVPEPNQLENAFNKLWNFAPMVARLDEVRQHAPNDYVANAKYSEEACAGLDEKYQACAAHEHRNEVPARKEQAQDPCAPGKKAYEACVQKQQETVVRDLPERIEDRRKAMEANADRYKSSYKPVEVPASTGFALDRGSVLAYLENLPFDKNLQAQQRQRTFGAKAGGEAEAGKYIHDVWLEEIPRVCSAATASNPMRVVLHNAYFFPSANLAKALGSMVDGTYDCSQVSVTVLTNSIETTDLNVVNLVAHQTIKAFDEFYEKKSDPKKRAKFEYLEYQKTYQQGYFRSLHSKVSVFGDDIVIGSANADVRSFMMDSNNAMLVRQAPELLKGYLGFVDDIIRQPGRVNNMNRYFRAISREEIKARDKASFFGYLENKFVFYRNQPKKRKDLEDAKVSGLMDDAYNQMRDVLNSTGRKSKAWQDKFDEEFKPI